MDKDKAMDKDNITTLRNKLTWATGAIEQAIETMTPPQGARETITSIR